MAVPGMAVEVTNGKWAEGTPNNNISNTPPATGAIAVPQSPSGAVVTNTGRSVSATARFLSQMRVLNSWNGVRVPQNPV